MTVYGKKGSPAEKYAKDNGIAFVAVTLDVPKVRSAVVDNDTITLRFDKVDGAVEYQIYRKVGKGAFELLDTLAPAKAGIYSDADVEEGSRYTYYVIADGVNACSEFDGATVTSVHVPMRRSCANSTPRCFHVRPPSFVR